MGALMMPRLVRPSDASRIALAAGASLMVDDLRTLRPMPCSSGVPKLGGGSNVGEAKRRIDVRFSTLKASEHRRRGYSSRTGAYYFRARTTNSTSGCSRSRDKTLGAIFRTPRPEPGAGSREPRAESREPRAESREPRAESREPRADKCHLAMSSSIAASASGAVMCGLWLASISRYCQPASVFARCANCRKPSAGIGRVQ